VEKHKYARILYALGFFGSIIWGVTSVRDEYISGDLAEDILPIAIQALCCLAIAAWTGYEAAKLWSAYFKKKKGAAGEDK
jgi:hypothetical protein